MPGHKLGWAQRRVRRDTRVEIVSMPLRVNVSAHTSRGGERDLREVTKNDLSTVECDVLRWGSVRQMFL